MKDETDAVMELIEFCQSNRIHPTELTEWVRMNTKKGKKWGGMNHHSLLQEVRRGMKPLSF